MILVTGGAGFAAANFLLERLSASDETVRRLGNTACAGDPCPMELQEDSSPCHVRTRADVCDRGKLGALFTPLFIQYHPGSILHFAAENHIEECYA